MIAPGIQDANTLVFIASANVLTGVTVPGDGTVAESTIIMYEAAVAKALRLNNCPPAAFRIHEATSAEVQGLTPKDTSCACTGRGARSRSAINSFFIDAEPLQVCDRRAQRRAVAGRLVVHQAQRLV